MQHHLMEEWREIPGFPGNEASNLGGLRTYWYKVRNARGYGSHRELRNTPRPIPMSIDDNGYLHVNIYCDIDGKRYTRKVHVLIAYTFLQFPDDFDDVDYTVDHIRPGSEGKLDNCIYNLQWLPRYENIKKAYREGMCDDRIRRQNKAIMVYDIWTGEWKYFNSINDASYGLRIRHSAISHCLRGDQSHASHYRFEYADREDILLYGTDEYYDY